MTEAAPSAVAASGEIVAETGSSTVVPWWSVTKTVIAAAALTLARDGRIGLDDAVAPGGGTLRQLLQHRAGIADYGGLRAYHAAVARGDMPWPAADLVARAGAGRLLHPPGTAFAYSNIGTMLAVRALEQAAAAPLAVLLQERVLAPLGIAARLATVPADLAGVRMGAAAGYHPGWVYHGLLVGTVRDAALMLDRLLGGDLLPPGLRAAMLERHPVGGPIPGRAWLAPGYGLGLMIGTVESGGMVAGHAGGGPGSVIAVYRAQAPAAPRTAAVFALGDDQAAVERAAFAAALA